MDRLTLRWFSRDLNTRGALVTNTLSDSISDARSAESRVQRLQTLFDRAVQDERLYRDRPVLARRHAAAAHRQLSAEL